MDVYMIKVGNKYLSTDTRDNEFILKSNIKYADKFIETSYIRSIIILVKDFWKLDAHVVKLNT